MSTASPSLDITPTLLQRSIHYAGWPLFVLGTAGAYGAAAVYFGGLTPISYLVIAATTVVVSILIEQLAPYRADWATFSDPSLGRDIGHTALTSVFGERLGLVIATPLFAWVGYKFAATDPSWTGIWPTDWTLTSQIALAILLAEFLDYWRHRLEHEIGFLWPLHFVHHSANRLNTIKSSRNNVADMAGRFVFVFVPVLLLGAPPEFILWHGAAVGMLGIPAHANVDYRLPSFLHRFVLTPQVHRVHHMADPVKGNSNYANITPLFDVVFGSFTPPHPDDRHTPAGVSDNPIPVAFWAEALAPVIWVYYRLRNR